MRRGDGVFGKSTGFAQVAVVKDPVANVPLVGTRANRVDNACDIEPEHVRPLPVFVAATGELVVDRVQAHRMNFYLYFASTRLRDGQFTNIQAADRSACVE